MSQSLNHLKLASWTKKWLYSNGLLVELEIRLVDVQQLGHTIMLMWAKISEVCIQHLAESMSWSIKIILKGNEACTCDIIGSCVVKCKVTAHYSVAMYRWGGLALQLKLYILIHKGLKGIQSMFNLLKSSCHQDMFSPGVPILKYVLVLESNVLGL